MKLLYVIEHISAVGGLERILIEKMNALCREPDIDVTLLTVWHDDHRPAFTIDSSVKHVCLELPSPSSAMKLTMVMPRVLRRFDKFVHMFRPDVVVHFRAVGAMLAAFSSWKGYTIFEAHTARPYSNHRWLYRFMERKVDAVVCLTHGDADNYSQARRVEIIPNFTTIVPLPQRSETQSLGYMPHRCLFVGRLCAEKNPLRLLSLWCKIITVAPHLHLNIYGDGELRSRVAEEIVRLGMQDFVTLCGYSQDMSSVYHSHDLLLLTSVTEGLPMTIIEAMRCGLPVVSLDCCYGPSDIIRNGENGFVVGQEDDEAFVQAVLRLVSDASIYRNMCDKARESSCAYTPHAIMQRWKKLFSKR